MIWIMMIMIDYNKWSGSSFASYYISTLVQKFVVLIILWIRGKIFCTIFKFGDPQLCFRIFPSNYSRIPPPIVKENTNSSPKIALYKALGIPWLITIYQINMNAPYSYISLLLPFQFCYICSLETMDWPSNVCIHNNFSLCI